MGSKNNPGAFDCYAAAEPDEPMFVLLGRDPLASDLVEIWARRRAGSRGAYLEAHAGGGDPKVREALECARAMERWAQGERP
jgi:hypothetical protein